MNFSFSIDNKCQMRMVQFSGEVQLRTRKKRQKWFKSWDHGSGQRMIIKASHVVLFGIVTLCLQWRDDLGDLQQLFSGDEKFTVKHRWRY